MKKILAVAIICLLAFLVFSGCETHRAELYRDMYGKYVDAQAKPQGGSFQVCNLKLPEGGALPKGFDLSCSLPSILAAQSAHIQAPLYPPSSAGWGFLNNLVDKGAGVTTFGLGASALRSIVNKAVDGAGHNVTTTGSYNTDRHDVTTTTTQTGTFDSYNGDNRDNHPSTVTDSYNTDRHDINDSYNPVDRHDVYQSPYAPVTNPAPSAP